MSDLDMWTIMAIGWGFFFGLGIVSGLLRQKRRL